MIFEGQKVPEIYKSQVENWAKFKWQQAKYTHTQLEQCKLEAFEYRHKYEKLQETIINGDLLSLKSDYRELQVEIHQLKQKLQSTQQDKQKLIQEIKNSFEQEREKIIQFKSKVKQDNSKNLQELEGRILQSIRQEKISIKDLTDLSSPGDKVKVGITNTVEHQDITTANQHLSIREQALSKLREEPEYKNELKTETETNFTNEVRRIVEHYNSESNLKNLFDIVLVSLTKDSINQRRGGTSTTYFEQDNRLGNYWIISGADGQYLVPKYKFRMTTHNLESLMYLFTSETQIEGQEIDGFILAKPGIVEQEVSQSQWQLIEQGSLELIPATGGDSYEN
ncbi:MAG: hypothetical protein AAGF26_07545 [Cyanobacteria bacterium P01_G01_bin.49]